jgi:hypothetical protein
MVHISDYLPEINYRMHDAGVTSIRMAIYNETCHRQKSHGISAMTGDVLKVTNSSGVLLRLIDP